MDRGVEGRFGQADEEPKGVQDAIIVDAVCGESKDSPYEFQTGDHPPRRDEGEDVLARKLANDVACRPDRGCSDKLVAVHAVDREE